MPKAKATKPRTINVHLPEDVHRLLRTLSASSGVTYAKTIEMGLKLLESTPGSAVPQEPSVSLEAMSVQGETASEPADLSLEQELADHGYDSKAPAKGDTEPAPPPVVEDLDAMLAWLDTV